MIGRRKAELPEDVTDINLEEQEKQGRVVQVQIGEKRCSELSGRFILHLLVVM